MSSVSKVHTRTYIALICRPQEELRTLASAKTLKVRALLHKQRYTAVSLGGACFLVHMFPSSLDPSGGEECTAFLKRGSAYHFEGASKSGCPSLTTTSYSPYGPSLTAEASFGKCYCCDAVTTDLNSGITGRPGTMIPKGTAGATDMALAHSTSRVVRPR